MLSPTTPRIPSRYFFAGAALALLAIGLGALVTGFPKQSREQAVGALQIRGEHHLRGRHSVAPPLRGALAERRGASRYLHLSHGKLVDRVVKTEPQGADSNPVGGPSGQPAAGAPPTAPHSPSKPGPNPSPKPEPPPDPTPPPEPPPDPTPPPEPPPDPGPAPEPPPDPSPPPAPPPPPPSPPPEPPPPPPAEPAGEILFEGTFDAGFRGWYVQSLPGRASLLSSDPFEGDQAARFEVRDGDVEPDTGSERSEVSGPTFDEGQDLYIRDAILVPGNSTYQGPWQIIQQLHEEDWSGSPGMAVFLNSEPALQIGAGDSSPVYWRSPELEKDRWYDLIYRVNLSQDPGVGFVEVWLDGVQQTLVNGLTRAYGQTIQAAQTYIKAGIYRSKSSTGTSIVQHDSIVIGTSLAAVMSR